MDGQKKRKEKNEEKNRKGDKTIRCGPGSGVGAVALALARVSKVCGSEAKPTQNTQVCTVERTRLRVERGC